MRRPLQRSSLALVLALLLALALNHSQAYSVGDEAFEAALAARQADGDNAFWNPSEANIEAWRVIPEVEEGAITFWTMSLSPTFDRYLNQVVSNFEATYPTCDLTWEDVPWDGLQAKVRNSFSSGNPADVMNISPAWIAEFAAEGLLMNMDEGFADYPELRANYSNGAWNTMTYDGVSYQVPWYLGLRDFLVYNGAILEELGMSTEELPTSWEELLDFARHIREESDYYGISLNFGPGTELFLRDYLMSYDIPFYNEDGMVGFNSPEAAQALQVWVDMVEEDLIPISSLTDDHRDMISRFSEGETVLLRVAPHMIRLVNEENPEVYAHVGIAPGIMGASGALGADVQSLVIPASSPNPKCALALATFVTNAETFAEFSKWAGIFPSNLASYADPFFQSTSSEIGPDPAVIRPLAADYVANINNPSVTYDKPGEVDQIMVETQQSALLGEMSAQEALDKMSERINALLQAE